MAGNVIEISRKERTSDEVLDYLDGGKRVIVEVGLGITKEVTLRKHQNRYICDTGL